MTGAVEEAAAGAAEPFAAGLLLTAIALDTTGVEDL